MLNYLGAIHIWSHTCAWVGWSENSPKSVRLVEKNGGKKCGNGWRGGCVWKFKTKKRQIIFVIGLVPPWLFDHIWTAPSETKLIHLLTCLRLSTSLRISVGSTPGSRSGSGRINCGSASSWRKKDFNIHYSKIQH